MSLIKRIFWFLALNLVIILTISVILQVLGVNSFLTHKGMDYQTLFVFSMVVGFTGSFISLQLSRFMAKMFMNVKVIDPQNPQLDRQSQRVLQKVYDFSRKAGLKVMPQVGIYQSPEVNAFATGPSRRRSLVAVSTGLLDRMNDREVEGVVAHEVAHIANGDMVTMALLQGVINTFVYFLARALAFALARQNDESDRPHMSYALVFLFEILFGLMGLVLLAAFSRFREYRADRGGAQLAGVDKMKAALEKLQMLSSSPQLIEANASERGGQFSNFKINRRERGWTKVFSTHPPLHLRIDRLKQMGGF